MHWAVSVGLLGAVGVGGYFGIRFLLQHQEQTPLETIPTPRDPTRAGEVVDTRAVQRAGRTAGSGAVGSVSAGDVARGLSTGGVTGLAAAMAIPRNAVRRATRTNTIATNRRHREERIRVGTVAPTDTPAPRETTTPGTPAQQASGTTIDANTPDPGGSISSSQTTTETRSAPVPDYMT